MKSALIAAACLLALQFAAAAQMSPPAQADAPGATVTPPWAKPPVPTDDKTATPAPAPQEPSKGDTLTLKSGTVLKNVQVLRRLPSQFEVEVSEGVILAIPTKQVEKVTYDDIEPLRNPKPKPKREVAGASDIIQGDKIQPELSEKLAQPFPEPALKFVDQDLLEVLEQLSQKLGLSIEAEESVKSMPADQRVVNLEIKPGTNLATFLQQDLGKLKDLTVEYQFDKILIKKRAQAAAPAAGEPPVPETAAEPASPATLPVAEAPVAVPPEVPTSK